MPSTEGSAFDRATAVRPLGDGRYAADLDPGWGIEGMINGGYLLATVVRAVLADSPFPHPLTAAAQYASAPAPGPAEIVVEPVRGGRSTATWRARLVQEGQPRVDVLATTGTLRDQGTVWTSAPVPAMPDPEDLPRSPAEQPGIRVHLLDRLDVRYAGGEQARYDAAGEYRAWWRLADGGPVDPLVLLLALDAMAPASFALLAPPPAATLQLAASLRGLPAPGWLSARQRVRHLGGGWFDEDCDLADSTGRVVASCRQTATARLPEGWAPPGTSVWR